MYNIKKTILIFFIIFCYSAAKDCELRLNEINSDNPSKEEQMEFIELTVFGICKTYMDLGQWRILFVKGFSTSHYKPEPTVLGYISFPHGKTKPRTNGLFLIGPDELKPDISFKSNNVYLRHLFNVGTSLTSFIPNGNKVPHAILLLKIDKKDATTFHNYFQISHHRVVSIDTAKSDLIKTYLIDMVVYSRKASYDKCSIFEEWVPRFTDKQYVLTDYNTNNHKDYSLNRCTASRDPFLPEYFKVGKLTPGKRNDCTGPIFILTDFLAASFPTSSKIGTSVSNPDDPSTSSSSYHACTLKTKGVTAQEFFYVPGNKIAEIIDTSAATVTEDEIPSNVAEFIKSDDIEEGHYAAIIKTLQPCVYSIEYNLDNTLNNATLLNSTIGLARLNDSCSTSNNYTIEIDISSPPCIKDIANIIPFSPLSENLFPLKRKCDDNDLEETQTDKSVSEAKKRKVNPPQREWERSDYFQASWETFMSKIPDHIFRKQWIKDRPQWKKWLEIKPDFDHPEKTKFRCRICHNYYDKYMDSRYKPQLADWIELTNDPKARIKNYEKILEHEIKKGKKGNCPKSSSFRSGPTKHQQLIARLVDTHDSEFCTSMKIAVNVLTREQEEMNDGKYKLTANMLRTVYAEAKLNIPFSSHTRLLDMMEKNGLNIGFHHKDRTAASRMIASMSELMHLKLLKHLDENDNSPLSIILDSSTDYSGDHYLIVYIKSIEMIYNHENKISQELPVLYFYKLIHLTDVEEDADAYMSYLKKSFVEDKLKTKINMENIVKNRLTAFGSDGASVMAGKKGGLLAKLRDYTGKSKLLFMHCLAHRLQLAIGKAWKKYEHFSSLEDIVNDVYNFYNNRGHKRKAHLKKTIASMEMKSYVLKKIFKIRWVASEKSAILNLIKSYKGVLEDLLLIERSDSDFSRKTKKEASELLQQLRNRYLVVYMHFILDILRLFELLSLKLQSSTDTLPTTTSIITEFRNNLLSRKNMKGLHETTLLSSALCEDASQASPHKCESWNDFYNADEVFLSFISPDNLLKGNGFPHMDEIRNNMVDDLIVTIDKYFPLQEFVVYNAFMPKNLPNNIFDCETYFTKELNNFFAIILNENSISSTIMNDWNNLLGAIIEHPNFEQFKSSSPVTFWSKFLAMEYLPWTKELKFIMRSVLTIPIASADAERGFSILKHIKYDRRSSLSATTIDALLRLRINGPEIKHFNAYPYALYWEKTGHWLTDSGDKSRSKETMTKEEKEIVEDFIDKEQSQEYRRSNLF